MTDTGGHLRLAECTCTLNRVFFPICYHFIFYCRFFWLFHICLNTDLYRLVNPALNQQPQTLASPASDKTQTTGVSGNREVTQNYIKIQNNKRWKVKNTVWPQWWFWSVCKRAICQSLLKYQYCLNQIFIHWKSFTNQIISIIWGKIYQQIS